jgi:hypothetical protein
VYLEAIAHRYVAGGEVDQKPGYEERGNLPVALYAVSHRAMSHTGLLYSFLKSHSSIIYVVETADTRTHIHSLSTVRCALVTIQIPYRDLKIFLLLRQPS